MAKSVKQALSVLAGELYGDRDPAALFTRTRPIRLEKRGERTVLEIDLPNVAPDEVKVTVHGRELLVGVRDAQRRIALPDSVAGREIASVRLEAAVLQVRFGA